MYKGSLGFTLSTSSRRRITLARWRWTLRTPLEWLLARQKTIASTKACSIARVTWGFTRMSGAVFARWLAASCRLRSRDRAIAGGATLPVKEDDSNSCPIMVSPAAAKSSRVKDIVPHLQGAEDRWYQSRFNPNFAI